MTNVRWKRTGAVLAGLMLAVTAGACGGGAGSSSDTLTVWFPGTDESEMSLVNEEIVPQFEKETGREVEVTFVDWADMSPKLNAAFAAGTAPDVFGHGIAATADLVANERIEDLTPYVEELGAEETKDLQNALPGGQVDDRQYTMPILMTLRLMVYSAADFSEAGLDADAPPETWEEVRSTAAQLTETEGDRISHSGLAAPSQPISRQQTYATLLWSNGGELLTEDENSAALSTPEALEALEYFTELYQGDQPVDGTLGQAWSDEPPAQQPIASGKASMQLTSVSEVADLQQAAPDRKITPMEPLAFKGEDPAAFGGPANGLMINRDSQQKDQAWQFIEFMISEEISTKYATELGNLPIRKSAAKSDAVKSDELLSATLDDLQYAHGNPNVPGWVQMRDELDKSLESALRGKQPPEEALKQASSEIDALLAGQN